CRHRRPLPAFPTRRSSDLDGYAAGATGHMGSISAAEFAALGSLYNPAVAPLAAAQFGEIDGLTMGGALTFSDGLATPITFAGGKIGRASCRERVASAGRDG